jgi:hypothetical protein
MSPIMATIDRADLSFTSWRHRPACVVGRLMTRRKAYAGVRRGPGSRLHFGCTKPGLRI